MKNLYLLPTDKPSRLWIDLDSNELKFENLSSPNSNECIKCLNKHIYITSYEKVKIGDWSTDGNLVVLKNKSNDHLFEGHFPKKIILTTDPDLIADGVQQIDDAFLAWFVNNPTCEEVNVFEHNRCCGRCMGVFEDLCYSDMTCDDHKELGCEICYGRRVEYIINIPKEEPKQESRMYSEEDMIEFCEWVSINYPNQTNYLRSIQKGDKRPENIKGYSTTKELFEKFKNK